MHDPSVLQVCGTVYLHCEALLSLMGQCTSDWSEARGKNKIYLKYAINIYDSSQRSMSMPINSLCDSNNSLENKCITVTLLVLSRSTCIVRFTLNSSTRIIAYSISQSILNKFQ